MNKSEAGLERRFCPGIIRQGCAYCRCPDRPCMQNPIFYGDYDRNEKERKTHEGVVMLLTNAGELVLWNPWLQSLHGYFFYFYEVKQLIERESCWWIERGRGGIYRGERLKRWWLCLVWPLGFTITFLVWTIGKNIKIRSSNHWLRLSGFSRTVSSLGLGRRCISPNPTFSYEVWTRLSLYSVLSTLMLLFFSVFITFSVVRPWKRPGFTTQSCGKFVMKR